jgi:ribonuclease-3
VVTTPAARPSRPSSSPPLDQPISERGPAPRDISVEGLETLGVPPQGGAIYELALTHRSYAYEQPEPIDHNERLEFLGDAILGAAVTSLIFNRYPDLAEGEMARLRASVVNTHALADLARTVDLGRHILLGKGEEGSGGRDKSSVLADTLEALIGAVYLDRGMEVVTSILEQLFEARIRERIESGGRYDAKTALQEVVVRDHGGFPAYRVASSGPDHDKHFTAHVYVESELFGIGEGRSKKEAEQNAAREALERLEALEQLPAEGGRDARAS